MTAIKGEQPPQLILASRSPRRRELLSLAGFEFDVIAAPESVELSATPGATAEILVTESASLKASFVARQIDRGIILAADTIAECGGQILGKPIDRLQARQMLELLRGRQHRVLTGVCLFHRPTDKNLVYCEQTVLRMDPLSDEQILQYLGSDGWIGKAGAFGYQDALDWVHIVQGSASNVVGLPVDRISEWIGELQRVVGRG